MKRNLNNIAIIIILTLAYNIQTLTISCHFCNQEQIRRSRENEEKTRQANEEFENLIINAIPEPTFEDPALWKVLLRKYGIKLFYTCFNFKTWLVQTYCNIKEVISETPTQDERD